MLIFGVIMILIAAVAIGFLVKSILGKEEPVESVIPDKLDTNKTDTDKCYDASLDAKEAIRNKQRNAANTNRNGKR